MLPSGCQPERWEMKELQFRISIWTKTTARIKFDILRHFLGKQTRRGGRECHLNKIWWRKFWEAVPEYSSNESCRLLIGRCSWLQRWNDAVWCPIFQTERERWWWWLKCEYTWNWADDGIDSRNARGKPADVAAWNGSRPHHRLVFITRMCRGPTVLASEIKI